MIYILDDEPSVCESTCFLLEACGFEVQDYTSANCFLEALGECEPGVNSCLLLDLSMPGMHGFQVKKALLDRKLALPVIYTTAYCDSESITRIEREGDSILLKPYVADDLVARIRCHAEPQVDHAPG